MVEGTTGCFEWECCPTWVSFRESQTQSTVWNLLIPVQSYGNCAHPFLSDCNFATFVLSYAVATTSDDRTFLRKLKCHYVVLDEGHMLKNMQSQRYQGLMKVKVDILCASLL